MKERPILYQGAMVRAILDGRKTQTRRIIKSQWQMLPLENPDYVREALAKCPYGQPGDRLWVKETHWRYGQWGKNGKTKSGKQKWKFHAFNNEARFTEQPKTSYRTICGWYKRPSIFMPHWASRITLEIAKVRVERLQDISGCDVLAEGVDNGKSNPTMGERWENMQRMAFEALWDSLNAKRGFGWDVNPWVWVIEFKRLKT